MTDQNNHGKVSILFPDMEDTFLGIETILFIHVVEIKLQPGGQESLIACEQIKKLCHSFVKSSLEISPITAELQAILFPSH